MTEIKKQKSWWSRNWKWVVPTGGCLFIIIAIILFAGTLFYGISSTFKNSDSYNEALQRAQENEQVISILGEPIETNGMTHGSFQFENDTKYANLSIPIKGPKKEAKLRVKGEATGDVWEYEEMYVFFEGADTLIIDLLKVEKILED